MATIQNHTESHFIFPMAQETTTKVMAPTVKDGVVVYEERDHKHLEAGKRVILEPTLKLGELSSVDITKKEYTQLKASPSFVALELAGAISVAE